MKRFLGFLTGALLVAALGGRAADASTAKASEPVIMQVLKVVEKAPTLSVAVKRKGQTVVKQDLAGANDVTITVRATASDRNPVQISAAQIASACPVGSQQIALFPAGGKLSVILKYTQADKHGRAIERSVKLIDEASAASELFALDLCAGR